MNSEENLKEEVKALKAEVDELKKQLKANSEADERRHKEVQQLQKQQHQDDMKWKKIGAVGVFSTPLTMLPILISWWSNRGKKKEETKSDNSPKNNLSEIAEIIRESKK